jgi:hypothetical protein
MLTTSITHYGSTQSAAFHRICSWCRSDLGALEHSSQDHSYGICETCAYHYFAYLYEPEATTPLVGAREIQLGVN